MQKKRIRINLMLLIFIFISILVFMYFGIKFYMQKKYYDEKVKNQLPTSNKHEETYKQEVFEENNTIEETAVIEQTENVLISSKLSPLNVGQDGVALKLEQKDSYKQVAVNVKKVIRGSQVDRILKNLSGDKFLYTEPIEQMEWIIIEYEIDLTNIKMREAGNTVDIGLSVEGLGNNTSVKYDNKIYNINVYNLNKEEYIKDEKGIGRYALQIPKNCKDYIIVLGDSNDNKVFYKGE